MNSFKEYVKFGFGVGAGFTLGRAIMDIAVECIIKKSKKKENKNESEIEFDD